MTNQQSAGYEPEHVIADLGQQLGEAAVEIARLRAALRRELQDRNERDRTDDGAAVTST